MQLQHRIATYIHLCPHILLSILKNETLPGLPRPEGENLCNVGKQVIIFRIDILFPFLCLTNRTKQSDLEYLIVGCDPL